MTVIEELKNRLESKADTYFTLNMFDSYDSRKIDNVHNEIKTIVKELDDLGVEVWHKAGENNDILRKGYHMGYELVYKEKENETN